MRKFLALGCHNNRKFVICQDDSFPVVMKEARLRLALSKRVYKRRKGHRGPEMRIEFFVAMGVER